MYENGKRVEGYQKKRLHKRKMKASYAKTYFYGDGEYTWKMLVTEYKDEPRMKWGHPLDYWKDYSLTEQRSMAKEQTNRALRREFNNYKNKIILEEIETWEAEVIHDKMIELATNMEVKNGIVLWPMRVALSGKAFTPGGGIEIATLLGKEETIERIKKGIEKLS